MSAMLPHYQHCTYRCQRKHWFDELMTHIMEGINIPKVRIERVVAPVLSMFIDRMLSRLLNNDVIIKLGPEFSLRKASMTASESN
jgi:hypothetical protein